MLKAIGYVRVSTQDQSREGVSLDAQMATITQYCALRKDCLIEIISDPAVSASIPLHKRPGGKRVVEMLDQGQASIVVAVKLDRLFRDVVNCLQTLNIWEEKKVGLHLVDFGGQAVDTTSAMGRFMIGVFAQVAEMERNLIRERTIAALQHKRSKGEYLGSLPYGWCKVSGSKLLTPDVDEQEVIKDILDMRTKGMSYLKIANALQEAGIPPRGEYWHATTIQRILKHATDRAEKENS